MPIKISFVGAGSIGFTRKLVTDLLSVPELENVELSFMDIDPASLDMVTAICRADIAANGKKAKITATTKRRVALRGADYVFCVVRVGGLEAFRHDVEIPLKFGIDQCVGDTLCAGGIMYGQRGIPVILDICRDIREVASPDCLLINYANPMAMLTWAANAYGGVNTVGLCHGVQHGHKQIADALGFPVEAVDITCAGINHQTWYLSIKVGGQEQRSELLDAFRRHPKYSRTEKVRIDMLQRFGYYSTESNGHLSEYLPWYRKRPREIKRWIDPSHWIHGETGGYLRACTEGSDWFKVRYGRGAKHEPVQYSAAARSEEHGSRIIEAIETGRIYRGHFNRVNQGTITNLPSDAVIEAPGYVDRHGITMQQIGELPPGCAAVCNWSISVQRLSVLAAVEGNIDFLRQAMLLDPLTSAVCDPNEVWELADELLLAESRWLPQYKSIMRDVETRVASRPERPRARGAARKRVRAVSELLKLRGSPRAGH